MLKKTKLLSILSLTPLAISAIFVACSSKNEISGYDKNGKPIPLSASDINKYLTFKINTEAVENTMASVALKSINDADDENKFNFLRSFLIPVNEVIPKQFSYKIKATKTPNRENSIIVTITSINRKDNIEAVKNIQIDNFKPEFNISDKDYQTIYNNLLEAADLRFLIEGIQDSELKPNEIRNRNNYIRWTTTIMSKYDENIFDGEPVANLYYAGFYNAGGNSDESKKQWNLKKYELTTIENRAKEKKAILEAQELLYKKEIQPIKNPVTDKVENEGYSDGYNIRKVVQKLTLLASALKSNVPNNPWYENAYLKTTIKNVLDDFSTKYFYEGQQQYVNWWNYEIGITKDLVKLLSVIRNSYPDSDFENWTKGIKYFLPNARYGGSAPTAIHGFKPVIKKRLQTGANVIDNVKPILISAILSKDQVALQDAILAMYDTIFREYVTSGDGFYLDGSFLQHENISYVGSYGEVLFTGTADIFEYFKNTELALPKDPRFRRLYEFIELSVMPFMFKMSIQDGLSGRAISRQGHSDKNKGMNILGTLAIFVKEAPEEFKSRLHNFIWDQTSDFTVEELIAEGKANGVRENLMNAILDVKNSDKMPTSKRNRDWQYYETNYFNKYNEPSSSTPLAEQKNITPGGVDLAVENNGMVFTKNQDRYVWKQKDWMFNINLRGRVNGFSEAMLGENLDSYYYSDGTTLLHTAYNHNPYGNEFWTTVNYNEVPGTSAINTSTFDLVYNYRLPKNKIKDDYNDEEKEKHEKFLEAYKEKQKNIEEKVSLKTNRTFTNGIIFQNTGMVKSKVFNYNNSLRTTKAYLMIDEMVIVVGNVNKKSDDVNTTVENRMNPNATKNLEGNWENLNDQAFNKLKLGNKDLFVFNNTKNFEQNGYVILGTNKAIASKNNIEKYPQIANAKRNSVTDRLLTRSFDKLSFNHKNNNTFAYSIIPNFNPLKAAKYQEMLDNIEIVYNNSNYIVVKYRKKVGNTYENYYYVNSFFEENKSLVKFDEDNQRIESDQYYDELVKKGLDIPGLDLNFKFNGPTSMVVKQIEGFKDMDIVISSDLNESQYQFSINKNYKTVQSRVITNYNFEYPKVEKTPEVKIMNILDSTAIIVDNDLGEFNDYNHNVWIKLGDYNE